MALSGFGAYAIKLVLQPLFWLIIIVGLVFIIWMLLVIRRKRRLQFPTLEIVDLGDGKFALNKMKSGYFGKILKLRGLFWSGEEVLRTQYGDIIEQFSTEDYQEVDGKRGVVCYRHPLNQKVLLPISKLQLKDKQLVANIAPADFTDASVEIIKDAERETRSGIEKILQWIVLGGMIIFALVSIIVIIQYVKHSQTEAANLILEAGKTCLENAKEICQNLATNIPSGSAP